MSSGRNTKGQFLSGIDNPMHWDEAIKRKQMETRKALITEGKIIIPHFFKKGMVSLRKGIELTEETKQKLRLAHLGKKNPKNSQLLKGRIVWNKGKTGIYSEETIRKIRAARLKQKIPKNDTSIEIIVKRWLDSNHVQYVHPFVLGDKFECDFAIPKASIIIECDGEYWHSRPDMVRRDNAKDAYAKKCGWTVIRLMGGEILDGSAYNIMNRGLGHALVQGLILTQPTVRTR
jgi:very-short-patch-repair endonuclease